MHKNKPDPMAAEEVGGEAGKLGRQREAVSSLWTSSSFSRPLLRIRVYEYTRWHWHVGRIDMLFFDSDHQQLSFVFCEAPC